MLTQPPKQCLISWYLASAGQLIITVGRGPSQTVVSGSQVTCDWEIIDNWKIQAQTLCFGLHVLKKQQKLPNAANLVNTAIWAQGNIWQMGPICQQNVLSMDYFLRLPQTSNFSCEIFRHQTVWFKRFLRFLQASPWDQEPSQGFHVWWLWTAHFQPRN